MLVAHQFVCAGGILPDTCESESLSVGGTDGVDASLFDGFDYVALGHLHKAQRIGRDTVRYAGSPLKYSLSETDHRKSYPLVTLGEKGEVDIRLIPVKPRRELRRIRGELSRLLEAGREDTAGREDYIWAVLTGEPGLDPAQRLRLLYPNLLHVEVAPPEEGGGAVTRDGSENALSSLLSPEELFASFFQSVNGRAPSPSQRERVEKILAGLREDDDGA